MTDQKAQDIFCQLISRYPGLCKSSAPAFRSVLWSFLKEAQPWRIAVLVAAFECNAGNLKLTADPRAEAANMVFMLENGYGIASEKAIWAVGCWCKAMGIAWRKPVPTPEKNVSTAETKDPKKDTSSIHHHHATRVCSKCKIENDGDSLYCRKCGNVLVMLCPSCEAACKEGDTFCSKCGRRLGVDAPSIVTSNKPYSKCKDGDVFKFGHFAQGPNGERLPIEWRVLKRFDDKLFVVSVLGMNCRQYHHANEEISWENCDLRRWLNGEFFRKAFTSEEQECVLLSNVDNWDNDKYGTPGGNATSDNVFLLSLDEACHYFADDADRSCKPTNFATAKGAYTEDGNCWWWLRSPGVDPIYAASIGCNGNLCTDGHFVSDCDDCVRPALYLKL